LFGGAVGEPGRLAPLALASQALQLVDYIFNWICFPKRCFARAVEPAIAARGAAYTGQQQYQAE
jgi:hypothetical protein